MVVARELRAFRQGHYSASLRHATLRNAVGPRPKVGATSSRAWI